MEDEFETAESKEIADWWASNPQTYASTHGGLEFEGTAVEFGTKNYFENADRVFLDWNRGHHTERPFGKLFPYDEYSGKEVLEVGCGQGFQAANWAMAGAHVTAVDLNPQAVAITKRRFEVFNLSGTITQCDARSLDFDDATFEYVYSWGVLHHSPDLRQSLAEVMRVLKPNGRFGIYLYHRRSFYYLWGMRFVEGLLHYENRFLDPAQLASRYSDGWEREGNPHTWPVLRKEISRYLAEYANDLSFSSMDVHGNIPMWNVYMPPLLRDCVPKFIHRTWNEVFNWNLWTEGQRKPVR